MDHRDQRADSHSPLETNRDVNGDRCEEEQQRPGGLLGDFLAPGWTHRFESGDFAQRSKLGADLGSEVGVFNVGADAKRVFVDDLNLGVVGIKIGQEVAGLSHRRAGRQHLEGGTALEVDTEVEAPEEKRPEADEDQHQRTNGRGLPHLGEVDVVGPFEDVAQGAHADSPAAASAPTPNALGFSSNRSARTFTAGPMKKYVATRSSRVAKPR